MNELVSIVTTLYNYRRYIGELAQSIFNQSYFNWEWIIVDDASTDKPLELIRKWPVKYIRFPKNRGYSSAKNEGIINSKGKYIVMIDADDILISDSIRLRKDALDKHPDKLWCHGEVQVLNGGKISECSRIWKRNFRKQLLSDGVDLNKTYHHRLIHAQSVMIRPELHRRFGLYDESLRFSADNEMWRRVIRFGCIPIHIEDFVAIYRVHPDRMSRSAFKMKRKGPVKKKIIQMVEQRFKEGIHKGNTKLWART